MIPEPTNTPNPQGNAPEGGAASGEQTPAAQAPSKFNELKAKKGFKSEEDLATSYEEVEKSKSKFEGIHGKVKQQLESAGYVLDEEGNIRPKEQGGYQPQQPQVPQETIYDPYTGQVLTDPIQIQLARMPVGQREAFIFNAMQDQREKLTAATYQAEAEVLAKPEAKGFEDDVKKVIQALPLQQRANKQTWEDALLRVKGMRYDQAIKNAGQQGVENFINKEGIQTPQGQGSEGGGATLDAEQEQIYRYYQQNHPGMFKDKAHFLRATKPSR